MDFQVQVFGEAIVRRRFVRFAQRATDASDAMREVAGILRDATAENFRTRGVSGGSRWRDLAPATRARKARLGLDPRILFATERLYHSLVTGPGATARSSRTGRFAPGGRDHVEEVRPDGLTWGSRVPYGVYHQSTKPRTVIPYRPPVRLNELQKRRIAKAVQRSLVEGSR